MSAIRAAAWRASRRATGGSISSTSESIGEGLRGLLKQIRSLGHSFGCQLLTFRTTNPSRLAHPFATFVCAAFLLQAVIHDCLVYNGSLLVVLPRFSRVFASRRK